MKLKKSFSFVLSISLLFFTDFLFSDYDISDEKEIVNVGFAIMAQFPPDQEGKIHVASACIKMYAQKL